ncbi:hypothetical protein AUEXF2481DRAFT_30849 [Aureobasidium subglaciale EXF-2481]|uniref:Uncharacterized protein n=1 Tax=Aureobasidium subglaciale (strain EXF-2481) TaxID=1043005 RepID=A0A074Z438_AURSE|nr:uncharacterized protein AUEXF2481DRAFT_30849 [Aureobasidium subglaciale EXF-2481]KAI5208915.1 hypothetical protein E4T38_02608 [Aureobasidium subglaciale]KAI5227507.1 hypothetical protein E4T40_02568 [Aureobasidium subglaciale]KAI5231078.1 hypothetical protein E4T41_02607 [Aureobasidium subglaciale]KAI5265082.1 hypothetical protein E4T46_02385 [Aureobasidium subglaciale]KEQ93766.1 hypothetical protein AUEXF2481DRAFT_30849 [Aureobasidium subglaciale EXF-2481]
MPPIPIYADAPIAAAKADGVTPQTAPPPTRTVDLPATTTSSGSSYPAAQPGAVAGPAPTGSVSRPAPPPTSTVTTSLQIDEPPPPQPGAAPIPSTRTNAYDTNSPAAPRAQPMPQQLSIPPPTTSALATHSTAAASPTSPTRRPVTLPMGPVSPTMHSRPQSISTHPPGYQQNPYAAELTSAQRASLEAAEAAERGRKSGRNSISEWIAGEDDGFGSPTAGTAKAWGAVKGLATQAGQWAGKANEFASKKLG